MTDKKTIGVILSGAGYLDGAEIQESVLCLLALDEAGVEVRIFAPNIELDEVDHKKSESTGKKRNVLTESARIARGKVDDIAKVNGTEVDGWVLPGGYGAAKNLCDFAVKGAQANANKDVSRVIREALAAQMPVGACCIAPALLAVITKNSGPQLRLTIGDDIDTAKTLASLGAEHVNSPVNEVVIDADHKVVTVPAYMYGGAPIREVAEGIRKMVAQVVDWA